MNRAAARSYPFQVIRKFMFNRPGEVFYIGGNDILPAPLSAEREAEVIEMLGTEKEKEGKSVLTSTIYGWWFILQRNLIIQGRCGGSDLHRNHRAHKGYQYL